MPALERNFQPFVSEDSMPDRRSSFICLKICLRILGVLLPVAAIVLAIYAGVASSTLTEYGTCPSEYNSVFAGHCSKPWSWSLEGPPVDCDASSKFNVPYWYRNNPLCTTEEVNIITTLSIVSALLFVSIAMYGART
jgi:hypothetical protein